MRWNFADIPLAYATTLEIIEESEVLEPKSNEESPHRND